MKKVIFIIILLIIMPMQTAAFDSAGQCTILMDQKSKRVLYAKNVHTVRSVASISKIMTAIIAIESNKLNNEVTIGEEISDAYGSGIYIKVGEKLLLKDLIYGLMLRSGNDAALAIANYVGGSVESFVDMMNKKAKEIGMSNTIFNNPSGLDNDKGNYSTAYDMAILTSYAMENKDYRKIVRTKKYVLTTNMNTYVWHNKNKLLNLYNYTTGGKTGFTEIARRTLVSTASKDNLDLVIVTLNNGNDFSEHIEIYKEAFSNYISYSILEKGTINIYDERYYRDYNLYLKKSFNYPLNNQEKELILLKFELQKKRWFKIDDEIGKVKVMIGDKEIYDEKIYIGDKQKKRKNLINKFFDWIKNLW